MFFDRCSVGVGGANFLSVCFMKICNGTHDTRTCADVPQSNSSCSAAVRESSLLSHESLHSATTNPTELSPIAPALVSRPFFASSPAESHHPLLAEVYVTSTNGTNHRCMSDLSQSGQCTVSRALQHGGYCSIGA